jgi:hypothetical protein
MRAIKFNRGGSNTMLGNFGPGDVARCSDALARHLVDEVRVARYAEPVAQAVEPVRYKRGRR